MKTQIETASAPGGTYGATEAKVRVSVCVEVTARSVYGAATVGLAFDSGYRHHDNVSAVTISDGHTRCRFMVTRYTSHLVVEALSGCKNGKVRQQGKLTRSDANGCDNVLTLLSTLSHPWNGNRQNGRR